MELVKQPLEQPAEGYHAADTGAQCLLLGRDHLPGLKLGVENLLQSEINLSCANSTTAGNLEVLFSLS